MQFDHQSQEFVGAHGTLPVGEQDEVALKLAMLIEGECEGLGPSEAARKYGYTKQRYFQLLHAYEELGSAALLSKPRGPKRNYRRTDELVRQVIRHRFLDPEASAEVIAQKLCQTEFTISTRSVERVIAAYGLQKKNLRLPPPKRTAGYSWDPDGNWYGDKQVHADCSYDSDGDGNNDRNWAIDCQTANPGEWYDCYAAHSQPLNGNLKAYAAWWLWARLAGWDGN